MPEFITPKGNILTEKAISLLDNWLEQYSNKDLTIAYLSLGPGSASVESMHCLASLMYSIDTIKRSINCQP